MLALPRLLPVFIANLFKSRRRLETEILCLRHQLDIALRQRPARLPLRASDRALLVWMIRLWPSRLGTIQVVEPATILRWHRAGFRTYWRWKSRKRTGRPQIDREYYRMQVANLARVLNTEEIERKQQIFLRSNIDRIQLKPNHRRKLEVNLYGHLAGIISLAGNKDAPLDPNEPSIQQVKLVAGACLHRDRHWLIVDI
jgi:hypothetical protein